MHLFPLSLLGLGSLCLRGLAETHDGVRQKLMMRRESKHVGNIAAPHAWRVDATGDSAAPPVTQMRNTSKLMIRRVNKHADDLEAPHHEGNDVRGDAAVLLSSTEMQEASNEKAAQGLANAAIEKPAAIQQIMADAATKKSTPEIAANRGHMTYTHTVSEDPVRHPHNQIDPTANPIPPAKAYRIHRLLEMQQLQSQTPAPVGAAGAVPTVAPTAASTAAPVAGSTAAPVAGSTAAPAAGSTAAPVAGSTAAPAAGSTAAPAAGSTANVAVSNADDGYGTSVIEILLLTVAVCLLSIILTFGIVWLARYKFTSTRSPEAPGHIPIRRGTHRIRHVSDDDTDVSSAPVSNRYHEAPTRTASAPQGQSHASSSSSWQTRAASSAAKKSTLAGPAHEHPSDGGGSAGGGSDKLAGTGDTRDHDPKPGSYRTRVSRAVTQGLLQQSGAEEGRAFRAQASLGRNSIGSNPDDLYNF